MPHGVSFVSVTQQFNTTTSMGRLTLNVLLSFAQFEREVTAERIRDKIAASKKKGMWMGGVVPLGYDVKDRKLVVNARRRPRRCGRCSGSTLRRARCARSRSARIRPGSCPKQRRSPSGDEKGRTSFSRGHLYRLLSNPIYIGLIAHRGSTYPGRHQAIIDRRDLGRRSGTARRKHQWAPSEGQCRRSQPSHRRCLRRHWRSPLPFPMQEVLAGVIGTISHTGSCRNHPKRW